MPGIYGFTKSADCNSAKLTDISNEMNPDKNYIQDDLFEDDFINASRVHLGKVGESRSPLTQNRCRVWVEGESYNHEEVSNKLNLSSVGLGNLILEAHQKGLLAKFLNMIDGYFCAAIYDQDAMEIKLISDRYGMRMLYWYAKNNSFVWGSEIKAILACKGIDNAINRKSLECFIDIGYLLGEDTWFENIKLIKPATILTFDLKTYRVNQIYYWTWAEIKPSNLTFNQAVDELGLLFTHAVKKRFREDEKIGISLSGGLDSRAILAVLEKEYPNFSGTAFTFGIPDCDDMRIAQNVINLTNWNHEKFFFNDKNWFFPRFKKIWNTDGMLDMTHMHGSEFISDISSNVDINISGFLGDAVFSSSYQKNKSFNDKKFDNFLAKKYFKGYLESSFIDNFYDIKHFEPLLYMSRGRRFINMSIVNSLSLVDQRLPFFDNNCIELIFSLPDEYRFNNRLYSKMLLKYFPKFFSQIPWQKTGKPVSTSNNQSIIKRIVSRSIREFKSLFGIKSSSSFVDYKSWVSEPDIADNLRELLNPSTSIYSNFLNRDFQTEFLEPHLINKFSDHSQMILRSASLEIYLKQLDKKNYLKTIE